MKKLLPSIVVIVLSTQNLLFSFFLFPTEGYQETMKYLKWGIIIFSFLVLFYGFSMMFKALKKENKEY
tara:strand:- start:42956 stop:43159 length:204 start_codon:yes stop_codon:yes gene_type:complete